MTKPIYSHTKNEFLNSETYAHTKLNFIGEVLETETTHDKGGGNTTPITIADKFTYDHAGRLEKQTQSINGQAEELISFNEYDELGQLVGKNVGGEESATNALQEIDYNYNIRGWLTNINDVDTPNTNKLFAFELNYNNPQNTQITPLYNGNISETHWRTQNTDNPKRSYGYAYDALNRIKKADYLTNNPMTGDFDGENEDYSLGEINYDRNGKITDLQRFGATATNTIDIIDQLNYSYLPNSNQLKTVTDTAGEEGFKDGTHSQDFDYIYDVNDFRAQDLEKVLYEETVRSTMTKDIFNIAYKHLNLPTKIMFEGAVIGVNKNISYFYDATGVKLIKTVRKGMTTDLNGNTIPFPQNHTQYDGSFIYEYAGAANPELKFFSHPEGYFEPTGTSPLGEMERDYVYQYKDHSCLLRLTEVRRDGEEGTVRLSYKDTNNNGFVSSSENVEENNYYPFGLKHKGYNNVVSSTNPALKYKFGGKEYQDELDLGWYDVSARNYDPALGRLMNLDLLADIAYSWTPYRFGFDNPNKFCDPDGNYERDGHYWTVYLAGLLSGSQNAPTIAYWAEQPDQLMSLSGDILHTTNTWQDRKWQVEVHALTGGNPQEERLLSDFSGNYMYETGNGHGWASFLSILGFTGNNPDLIKNRLELYLEYVKDLLGSLGASKDVDTFAFEYIANSGGDTEQNSAVLETEVRIQEGISHSTVGANQSDSIKRYIRGRNKKKGKDRSVKTTTVQGSVYKYNKKGQLYDTGKKIDMAFVILGNN